MASDMIRLLFLIALCIPTSPLHANEVGTWKSLFDGKTLTGWERHGGKATYVVEDGVIVGTSVPNTP
ncbi:MAG: DUF1080 domain-containing protein, partial [Verrucomicrobiaceae bacterium]|nr:DUF1080 domain-containing protein [Verrucomicrobiaceae bacterium]